MEGLAHRRGGVRGNTPARNRAGFVREAKDMHGRGVDEKLAERMEKLVGTLERMRLDEYVEFVSNRKKLIWQSILFGMLRGFGFMLGFTVLGAVVVVILSNMVVDNIPLIGDFLAEVVNAIQARM